MSFLTCMSHSNMSSVGRPFVLVLLQPDVCAQFDAQTLAQASASAFAQASSNSEGESSAAAEAAASVLASKCLALQELGISCT